MVEPGILMRKQKKSKSNQDHVLASLREHDLGPMENHPPQIPERDSQIPETAWSAGLSKMSEATPGHQSLLDLNNDGKTSQWEVNMCRWCLLGMLGLAFGGEFFFA